jgi:hypothetical protein
MSRLTQVEQGSDAANPAAGRRTLYNKADGWYERSATGPARKLVILDDAGKIPAYDGSQLTNIAFSAVAASLALTGVNTPASIGANQNDYNPAGLATASSLRLSSSGAFSITGLQGGAAGRVLLLINVGANNITLTHDDAGSTAANRFFIRGAASLVLTPHKGAWAQYDATASRWRVIGIADPYGSAANTACQGNDARLSDARTPTAHASTHQHGGSDEVATATPTANAIPKADATGKLAAGWIPGGAGATNYIVEDNMVTGNLTNDTIGKQGWRTTGNGTGNSLDVLTVAGHPGVLSLRPGPNAALGRRSIQLGQNTVAGGFVLGQQPSLEIEWLIRIRGTVAGADLQMIQLGLIAAADVGNAGGATNGIFVRFNPGGSNKFRAAAVNGGTLSTQDGTTVVAVNTWYRVSVVYTNAGSPSLQLKVNGANQGSPVTTNFPTADLSLVAKIDGLGSGTEPFLDIDRVRVIQTQSEET